MPINREPVSPVTTGFDGSQRKQTDALLRDLGADEVVIESVASRVEDDDVQSVVSRLRGFAEANPRVVLGALSALIAGGVVAGRAVAKKARRKSAAKSAAKRAASAAPPKSEPAKARASSKRTLIEPHPGDKRYVRRDAKGRIKESVDVGRSLAADARRTSKTKAKPGAGDKGDR